MEFAHYAVELSTAQYVSLLFASFFASLIGSLIGIGGGFIILGLLSILFPVTILIPVLAAVLGCIDLSRAVAFRSHLYTPICFPFLTGCIIGVTCGSILFVSLSDKVIGTGLALLILLSLVNQANIMSWKIKFPFVWIGSIHAFLSTMFGYGGLFQAAMLRTGLGNLQVTGTLAFSFFMLELMKISSYVIGGFDYRPYSGAIIAAACGAVPASIIGRKLAHRVNHKLYLTAQKIIVGLIAINILMRIWVM